MSKTRLVAAVITAASAAFVAPATAQAAAPQPFTAAVGQVTATTLTVRSSATPASASLGTLRHNDTFTPVCSTSGASVAGNRTWYWAISQGWVSAKYVHVVRGTVPACSATPDMHLMNAHVSTAAQVTQRLAGTSPSFRAFIAAELKAHTTSACKATISVDAWWNSNQAIGQVQDCAGYKALWTYTGGHWHELGTTGLVSCATVRRAGATHAINGNTGWACTVPAASGHGSTIVQYRP